MIKLLKYISFIVILPSILLLFECGCLQQGTPIYDNNMTSYSEDSVSINISKYQKNGTYTIKEVIDLQGKTWYLPQDIALIIDGGVIKNGIIKGNNTRLTYKGVVFDNVHIYGSWIVSEISTSMFANLSYENSLKDLFALTNPNVNNNVYIGFGTYYVVASKNFDRCLVIEDNTNLTIDGNIILAPNSFPEYSVLLIKGKNIAINGKGIIVGDKFTHLNSNGEWGMGISIYGGSNISIEGLHIKDCWGDCIYIAGKSKGITIEGCFLDNGRRQGVSIVSAEDVMIKNCIITNVGGTSPQYAIDVEPNAGDTTDGVTIEKVTTLNCKGGIMCYGHAKEAKVGRVRLLNSTIEGSTLCPIYFEKGENISVENCKIINCVSQYAIVSNSVDTVKVENNAIYGGNISLPLDKAIAVNFEKEMRVKENVKF